MPLYSYACRNGHEYEQARRLEDYHRKTRCPDCKCQGKRLITTGQKEPTFTDKLYPYYDPNLGKAVLNPRHRESIMKDMGLFSMEGKRGTTARQEKYLMSQRLHLNPQR